LQPVLNNYYNEEDIDIQRLAAQERQDRLAGESLCGGCKECGPRSEGIVYRRHVDRLYAPLFRYGSEMRKEFVVIMTSRGNMYGMTEDFFAIFSRYLGWKNPGNIFGAGKELQAQMLGKSI